MLNFLFVLESDLFKFSLNLLSIWKTVSDQILNRIKAAQKSNRYNTYWTEIEKQAMSLEKSHRMQIVMPSVPKLQKNHQSDSISKLPQIKTRSTMEPYYEK